MKTWWDYLIVLVAIFFNENGASDRISLYLRGDRFYSYNFNLLIILSIVESGGIWIRGRWICNASINASIFSSVSLTENIIISHFFCITTMFFIARVVGSASIAKLSRESHIRSLVSIASHESRTIKEIILFFVSEKSTYPHATRNNTIAPKKFIRHTESAIITSNDTPKTINRVFVLSKCSPL